MSSARRTVRRGKRNRSYARYPISSSGSTFPAITLVSPMLAWHRVKLAFPPYTGIRFTANIGWTHHQLELSPGRSSTFPFFLPLAGPHTHTTYERVFLFSFLLSSSMMLAIDGSIKERGTRLLSKRRREVETSILHDLSTSKLQMAYAELVFGEACFLYLRCWFRFVRRISVSRCILS